MALSTQPVSVLFLDLDDTRFVKKLKKTAKVFKRNANAWNQSLELVGKAFRLVDSSMGRLLRASNEWTRLAAEQIRVERRLKAILDQRGAATDTVFRALERENEARQQLLGVADEEQLQLQGSLALMGVRTDKLNEATEATLGLAEATGQDMASASRIIARVYQGQISALTRYGITATSTDDAIRQLRENYQILAANSDTLATRTKVLTANWGDFQEKLGMGMNNSTAMAGLVDALAEAVLDLTKAADDDALKKLFEDALTPAAVIAQTMSVVLQAVNALAKVNFKKIGTLSSPAALASALYDYAKSGNPGVLGEATFSETGGLEGTIGVLDKLVRRIIAAQAKSRGQGPGSKRRRHRTPPGAGGGGGGTGEGLSLTGDFFGDPGEFERLERENALFNGRTRGEENDREAQFLNGIVPAAEGLGQLKEAFKDTLKAANDFGVGWDGLVGGLKDGADLLAGTLTSAIQGFGQVVGQQIADLITGVDSLNKSFGQAVGDMLIALGTQLIQMGVASLVMGALSFIPGMQWLTGPPGAAAVAGAIALGTGAAMVGVGKAMGGGKSAGRAASAGGRPSGGASGGRPAEPPDPSLAARRGPGGAQNVTFNVNFNGVVSNPRRVRREIEDLLSDTSLAPGS